MKKVLKKLPLLILALVLVLAIKDKTYAATYGDLTYEVQNDGTIKITDCDGNASGALTIPSTIGGKKVTSIGYHAFYDGSSLTSITIPEGVTSIDSYAFDDCSSLTSINVSENNKNYCSVDGVLFNKDKTELIQYPIKKEGTSYKIPNSVTSIGDSVFRCCENLTSITIPNSVTSIGQEAFWGCSSLISITIPNSVTSIGDSAFFCCENLTSITIPEGVTSIGRYAFDECSSLTSITIPNSVTSIGDGAFRRCKNLTSITIPNSVTSIGDSAFWGCSSLTNITIPEGITSIGDDAFYMCSSLTSINVSENNKNYCSVDGVLFNKDKTELIQYPIKKEGTSYKIPNSVTSIGDRIFRWCENLTSITIPNSVTSIGQEAFLGCSSLTSITIPNSVTSIEKWVFAECSSLTSITIPEGVTSIGSYAFYDCSSLTSITIPEGVTSIGNWALSGCSSLTSINVSDNNKNYSSIDGVLFNKDKTEIIMYPYRKESTSYDIPNSVTSIGRYAFEYCNILTNITIPNSVTSIESDAIYDCSNLTRLAIPSSVTSIGNQAFIFCKSLEKVLCLGNASKLGSDAFKGCSSNLKIYAKNGLTGYDANGWENYSDKIVRYDESLKKITFTSRKQTEKIELSNAVFKSIASIKSYEIEDKSIVSVDSSGNVIPLKNGTTNVKAVVQYFDGTKVNLTEKIVVNVKSTGVAIKPSTWSFVDKYQSPTKKMAAKVQPIDTAFQDVTWKSSNTKVATVDSSGNVTAVGNGTCKITATTKDGYNKSVSSDVTVDIKAESINLDKTSLEITNLGVKEKLKADVSPSFSTINRPVKWSSSDTNVAKVDNDGNVTPVGNGTCKITATTTDGTNKTASCDVKVDIKAESIGFSLTSYKITDLAQTPSFTAKILPENTANKNVTWKSSDTSIATVSSSGVIKAVSNGTCKITATTKDGTNLSASVDIIVDIKANSVALDKTSMQITSQNSINKLVATVTPTQANQKVSWSSSNGNIAKVDSKGRVTPVSNGTCKIIATTTDGTNRTASCDVTVDVKFVTGISFDFNSYTITNVNQTPVFNPNITPSDAEDKSVRWSSSNTKVATVSSSGVIKVAGNGTCKITATTTDGTNLSASFNITVNIKSAKITLDKTKIELTTGKETEKITSSIEPSIANKNVKYTSSDESIATVSSDGVVTAVGSGTCKITAAPTDGSKVTACCDVTVDIKTTGMKLDKTNYTFNKAETIKINPVVTPSKASKKLTWTSSNTKVAIVSSDGKVTPVGKGTCKITATTTDGTNLSASCNITSNVEYQKGDVNRDGKVNTLDVYYAMKGIVNGTLTDEEKVILDVNGDSKANTLDINIIMRYIVGQIDSL